MKPAYMIYANLEVMYAFQSRAWSIKHMSHQPIYPPTRNTKIGHTIGHKTSSNIPHMHIIGVQRDN